MEIFFMFKDSNLTFFLFQISYVKRYVLRQKIKRRFYKFYNEYDYETNTR